MLFRPTHHHRRRFVALDISPVALLRARNIGFANDLVCGDIFWLPFKDATIDGMWNLGVMEHFYEEDILRLLNEFYRVLKPNSYLILFWPPVFGSTKIVLNTVERVHNSLRKKKIQFFPDEVSVLRSRDHAERLVAQTQFRLEKTHFLPDDLFTYYTLVLRK